MATVVPESPLLTVAETAARLGVSQRTIHRRIAAGELPAVKIGNGPKAPIRIDADELERFVYGEAS